MRTRYQLLLFLLVCLVLDQVVKIYVRTHFALGELYPVFGHWFNLTYIENEGMAFGWRLGDGALAKLMLTLLRIALIAYFSVSFVRYARRTKDVFFMYVFVLVLAGAMGNLIDSIFYGVLFEPHTGLLLGRVVDMFYFPLFEGTFPSWLPFFGGEHFLFFSPVFNMADAYISVGMALMIIFSRRFFFRYNHSSMKTKGDTHNRN